jgi:putative ABC transport system permease protein
VLFLAGIVFVVGAVITSQTLMAAVAGSVREYATLNARRGGVGNLRWVVLEQAFWVGATGCWGPSCWVRPCWCWPGIRTCRWY